MEKVLSVYIMASKTRVLYVGVTGNLWRRVREHKTGAELGFTKKYHVHRLVYFEQVHGPLGCHCPREGNQRLATREESSADRGRESGVAGSE